MPKKYQKLLAVLLGEILLLSVIAVTYAYFTASVTRDATPVSVTTTVLADLTMTSIKSEVGNPVYPGWVGYQGVDVSASGSGSTIYDLNLLITGGEHVLDDVLISVCKVENTTSEMSLSDFTFTPATVQVNSSGTPIEFYMENGSVNLPNNCTNVVDGVPLSTLGETYQISVDGGKVLEAGKRDKYYIAYEYENKGDGQIQGETFTVIPSLTVRAGISDEESIGATDDLSNANPPKLVDNLTPVVYNGEIEKWQMAPSTQVGWYNYSKQIWANAVTVVEDKRGTYSIGDAIEMDDILGMWVWIPRYEYKYINLGNQYAGGNANLPGAIDIKFIGETSISEDPGYIIHPAFRNGSSTYTNNAYTTTSAYQMSGWSEEITGFWMGKFETSSLESASGTTPTVLSDPIIKPNVQARRYQTISQQYETALSVKIFHGINTLDSHMSKNSEWGAVAYLSQSIYGKYGNTDYSNINKEIYVNNSSKFYTGRSMGTPANTNGASSTTGTYQYDEEINGTGASTTGNIYGIYDMAGGSWEQQMIWLKTASTNFGYRIDEGGYDTDSAGFSSAPSNHRYYEELTSDLNNTGCGGIPCYGSAINETAGWYGDFNTYPSIALNYGPWLMRGSSQLQSTTSEAGIFTFHYSAGYRHYTYGFRTILI